MARLYSQMIEESRQPPPRSVGMQSLLFYALFMISQTFQGVILFVPMLWVMFTSPAILAIVQGAAPDYGSIMEAAGRLIADNRIMIPMLFSTIATIATVLIAARVIRRRSFVSLGMRKKGALVSYLKGIAWCVPLLALSYLPLWTCVSGVRWNGMTAVIALYFVGFIVQSFSEELLCRGYLMNTLAARRSPAFGVVLNSVLFSALHLLNPGMSLLPFLNILLIGVLLSLVALYADDIWMASGVHFFWNFTISCVIGGEVSGMPTASLFTFTIEGATWQTGGAFGIEGSAFSTLAAAAMIIVFILLLRRKASRQAAMTPPASAYQGGYHGE